MEKPTHYEIREFRTGLTPWGETNLEALNRLKALGVADLWRDRSKEIWRKLGGPASQRDWHQCKINALHEFTPEMYPLPEPEPEPEPDAKKRDPEVEKAMKEAGVI